MEKSTKTHIVQYFFLHFSDRCLQCHFHINNIYVACEKRYTGTNGEQKRSFPSYRWIIHQKEVLICKKIK